MHPNLHMCLPYETEVLGHTTVEQSTLAAATVTVEKITDASYFLQTEPMHAEQLRKQD